MSQSQSEQCCAIARFSKLRAFLTNPTAVLEALPAQVVRRRLWYTRPPIRNLFLFADLPFAQAPRRISITEVIGC
jgi:hypothetical protein